MGWAATSSRRACVIARLLLRGKYWRSRPLVFSLLARCHGLRGSQKYTRRSLIDAEACVLDHLLALIARQGSAQLLGQRGDARPQRNARTGSALEHRATRRAG